MNINRKFQRILLSACLSVSSAMYATSPWASLSSSIQGWLGRPSYRQTRSTPRSNQIAPAAITTHVQNNSLRYFFGAVGIGAIAGYYKYCSWQKKRTGGTDNLAKALYSKNKTGIDYWMENTPKEEINKRQEVSSNTYTVLNLGILQITGGTTNCLSPLEVAVDQGSHSYIKPLIELRADPYQICTPVLLNAIKRDTSVLEILTNNGFDIGKKMDQDVEFYADYQDLRISLKDLSESVHPTE